MFSTLNDAFVNDVITFAGSYASEEIPLKMTITANENKLVLNHAAWGAKPMSVEGNAVFGANGYFFVFEADAAARVVKMRVTGGGLWMIPFQRLQ